MAENSKIEWTDHTFNAWWGCVEVFGTDPNMSACLHCYAREQAKRYGFDLWGRQKPRRFFAEKHWQDPIKWNNAATGSRQRVFCSSMADVFEDYEGPTEIELQTARELLRAKGKAFNHVLLGGKNEMEAARDRLWALIEQTPNLDWMLLTKRPENMVAMTPGSWRVAWPENVIAMTTVENQEAANKRIPELLKVPARRCGLSMEPLRESITLDPRWLGAATPPHFSPARIHWVIVGGESGPKARPMDPDWARSLRDQCKAAGVAFHFKQWGKFGHDPSNPTNPLRKVGRKKAGRLLDGRAWDEFPNLLSN